MAAHWAEVVGFATGAGCVVLAARRNIANFPLGIANNLVFLALFIHNGVYANAGLQVVYLVLGVHGWLNWRAQRDDSEFVQHVPRPMVPILVGAGVVGTAALWWVLRDFTDSKVPLADAATTAVSLVAQYMLNRRWLECWYVWIAVDVAYVVMYGVIGLPITAALYLLFIGLCVQGLLGWRRHRAQTAAVGASA